MWGGRFTQDTNSLAEQFNASIDVDRNLALEDIDGSIAHATMLAEQGVLAREEVEQIIQGLKEIAEDVRGGRIVWKRELEDVHMNIEWLLTERIGAVGGKLHTARSRNDQVATDFRLWLRSTTKDVIGALHAARSVFVDLADTHVGAIMPGYTHLQVAQPVLFSHHMLAYYEMLTRDQARFADSLPPVVPSPPRGAAALAGTTFPIDRHRTAGLLQFGGVARNSLDAVSDRDFALEFLSCASITMMHLSRLCEELILWSSAEFRFVTLPDSHTTGSSIMPQKKNPDVCELIRGKTGRVCGSLMGLLMVMKGLPLAYNKDMQEDKEGVLDAAETLLMSLELLAAMLPAMIIHADDMQAAATRAYSNATDLADYLTRKGMPFREAHETVGRLVALALEEGKALEDLDLVRMRAASELITADVYDTLALDRVVAARNSYGGTAHAQVRAQIQHAREALQNQQS